VAIILEIFLIAYDQQVKNFTCINETGANNTSNNKKAIGEKHIFNCFNSHTETNQRKHINKKQ